MAVPSRNFTFLWQIENLSSIWSKSNETVVSPTFKAFKLQETVWFVILSLRSNHGGAECLYVTLVNDEDTCRCMYDWEYSFLDADEYPISTNTVRNHDFRRGRRLPPIPDQYPGPTHEQVFVTKRSDYLPMDTLTLRLRIWPSEEPFLVSPPDSNEYFSTRTVLDTDRAYIMWDIEGFSYLQLDGEVSNLLHFANFDHSFAIALSLDGACLESASVKLRLTSNHNCEVNLYCEISVLDSEMKSVKTLKEEHKFDGNLAWVLPTFLTREEILDERNNYLNGDDYLSLLMHFYVTTYSHVETSYCSPADLDRRLRNSHGSRAAAKMNSTTQSNVHPRKKNENSVSILLQDFLSLYREKTLCDFELRSGYQSFLVHKVVLSARSPVFKNMLASDVESHNVNDLDGTTLDLLLTFLYGGGVPPDLSWEGAAKLFSAAVTYQVPSLKQKCSSLLQSGISLQNACEILLLSHQHDDEKLKSSVLDFLLQNMNEFISSDKWKAFQGENLQIASTTMQALLKRIVLKS